MKGLGKDFNGSYAEYALIPTKQFYSVDMDMEWIDLATIPETYYTAYGSLFKSLKIKTNESSLIRGGTSSVGITALQFAKELKVDIISTKRNPNKIKLLKDLGAENVIIDDENLESNLFYLFPVLIIF
ncbi:L-threonine 3-dehydrogenase [Candidatus Methanobinarius endosymbioticus]|uniref:L-threonine 3-dehydrogenase n=1 Tax=Candidatus Methanobinarius endosymbioticus TaxID=2006182 RepID=A0A366MGG1_9EURY|nr:L-threonine 3-dehydrogenase [Candidatus Methanobinarius endosymbioticus]